jgi:ferredoxin
MNYKDKETCDDQCPDWFDVEQDPAFQKWVDEQALKDQMQQMLEQDIEEFNRKNHGIS